MARTRNSFTGSAGDDTLVDKVLGRSYDVVKAVYLKLPQLEELQDNPNVNKLAENFDDVKEILGSTDSIINVNKNIDEILAASTYSAKAQTFSESAQSSAELAKTASDKANEVLTQANDVVDSLAPYEADLEVVSQNIGSIQTTAANIYQINYLADTFKNDLTVQTLNDVLANMQDIVAVADEIVSVTQVANKFVGTGELDRIEASAQDIADSLQEYYQVLDDVRQEVANSKGVLEQVEAATTNGVSEINAEASLRRAELNDTLEACKELIAQMEEANGVVSDNVDTANDILLKIRDIYHSFEEGINQLNKKVMMDLHLEGDHQRARIRREGETQSDRLTEQMNTIIHTVSDDMKEIAEHIKDKKLAELKRTADGVIATLGIEAQRCIDTLDEKLRDCLNTVEEKITECITTLETKLKECVDYIDEKVAQVEFDLSELDQKVTEVQNQNETILKQHHKIIEKIKDLYQITADNNRGDIRFGYYDFSLEENWDKMDTNTTYIVPFDENGNYIKINQDTNQFEKNPTYIRFYIKSESGNVSYIQRDAQIDLSGYLKKEDLKQATIEVAGIAELATVAEVEEGTDATRTITPFALYKGLPELLIKEMEQNPNGLTNHVVQQIVKTVAGDVHLQEDLAQAIIEELKELGVITSTGEGSVVIEDDTTIKGDLTVEDGVLVVPDQTEEDSDKWPDNVVLNKSDILKLVMENFAQLVSYQKYPPSEEELDNGAMIVVPNTDLLV